MHTLYGCPLFKGVGKAEVDRLTEGATRTKWKAGQEIIRQGSPGSHVFLLLEGKVEVFYRSKSGDKTTIIFHQAPFIFGEVEVWGSRPCLASVAAFEPSVTLALTKHRFLTMLHSNHQVAINLSHLLSELLYETGQDRRVKFFGKVENLTANLLCAFARLFGEERSDGILIRKSINKSGMSEMLGISRKSVIDALKLLEKEGLIRSEGPAIVIPSIEALREKARGL
jgi:CRP/FNR family transcriptional regulator, cyclic AMP receptor protein